MTLALLLFAFTQEPVAAPAITVVRANGETTRCPCGDDLFAAWCSVAASLSEAPSGATVVVPRGDYRTSNPLPLLAGVRYLWNGSTLRPLDPATHQDCLLYAATRGWHRGDWKGVADGWQIHDLTVDCMNADSAPAVHGLFAPTSSRCLLANVRVVNCRREGIVLNGDFNTVLDFSADLVGTGSVHRATTSSALNMGGNRAVVVRPRITRSGQATEFSSNDGVIVHPDFAGGLTPSDCNPPSLATQTIAIHVGSSNTGANGIVVVQPRVRDFANGLLAGNGNGTFGGLTVIGGRFDDAPAFLGGSRAANLQSPATPGLCPENARNDFLGVTFASRRSDAVTHVTAVADAAAVATPLHFHGLKVSQPEFVSAQAFRPFVQFYRWPARITVPDAELYLGRRLPRGYAALSLVDYSVEDPRADVQLGGVAVLPSGARVELTVEKETL